MVSGLCATVISTELSKNSLKHLLLMEHSMKITLVTFRLFKNGREQKLMSLYVASTLADSQGVKAHLSMIGFIG